MDISALNRRKEQIAFEMIEADQEMYKELSVELEEIETELETVSDFNNDEELDNEEEG